VTRASFLVFCIGFLSACGSGGGGGGGGNQACDAESDAALCESAHAACGRWDAVDACGTARSVDCGRCRADLVCVSGACVEPRLREYQVCSHDAKTLGACAEGLTCLGDEQIAYCLRWCQVDEDCPGEQTCGIRVGEGGGLCGNPKLQGESCHSWWDGPDHCYDPDLPAENNLACLGGACRITCNYAGPDGSAVRCPTGQKCETTPTRYPEYPDADLYTCVEIDSDPCRGIAAGGTCTSYQSFQRCVASGGRSRVEEVACGSAQRCQEGPAGANCVALGDTCAPGHAYCTSLTEAMMCNDDGIWQAGHCDTECRDSPTGAFCAPSLATTVLNGTLLYEHRIPNDDFTDWSPSLIERPAAGLLAISYRGDTVIDQGRVAGDGTFSLRIPAAIDEAQDRIVFFALGTVLDRPGYAWAVADPGLSAGKWTQGSSFGDVKAWLWSIALSQGMQKDTWVIREANGSAAMQLFAGMRRAVGRDSFLYGPTAPTVVGWYGQGVDWECGACFLGWPAGGFDSQIFFVGGSDRGYASEAVTLHEAGHYTMWAHGRSPGEGGKHCLLRPAMPGLAWSEGFASWYSSELRGDPIYYDKQEGTFFALSVDSTIYREPKAADGLLQNLDEMWVARSLRRIAGTAGSSGPLWAALASPRMTVAPFGRGYFRHAWSSVDDATCAPIDPVATSESAPVVADFLDALICAGMQAKVVDDAVGPGYPFPSSAPICR